MLSKFISPRSGNRITLILTNSINSLLVPLFSPLVSFFVVRLASVDLWGEFVRVLILVQLAAHVLAWGNKDYLLRQFSMNPVKIAPLWQSSLITRLALFIPTCLVMTLFLSSWEASMWVIAWTLGLVLVQACEVLVVYRREFTYAAIVEASGVIVMIATVLWFGGRTTLDLLFVLFATVTLAKSLLYLARFKRSTFEGFAIRFEPHYFFAALSFFLLTFTGMAQSRADLYVVTYFAAAHQIGQYQVFINLIAYVQAFAGIILLPFIKGLYRLDYPTIFKLSPRLFLAGLVVTVPALLAIYFVLTYFYDFLFTLHYFLAGALLILPIFFYLPVIYALYKANRQMRVVAINALGIVVNVTLSLVLLPLLGLLGAVVASALAQWAMLVVYLFQIQSLQISNASPVSELSPTG